MADAFDGEQEAERRIAAEAAARSGFLDLTALGLRRLPDSLFRLTHLRRLHLGRPLRLADGDWKRDWDRKGEMNAVAADLPRLAALPGLAALLVRGMACDSLVFAAGLDRETRWAAVTRPQMHALSQRLTRSEFMVTGKSLNKDEFVTCGGVKLGEVNFQTMESRVCPGLYFAGELLDIDGITGGFNFQAAWTTGYIAGLAMAAK